MIRASDVHSRRRPRTMIMRTVFAFVEIRNRIARRARSANGRPGSTRGAAASYGNCGELSIGASANACPVCVSNRILLMTHSCEVGELCHNYA